jgi:hypothetical protein
VSLRACGAGGGFSTGGSIGTGCSTRLVILASFSATVPSSAALYVSCAKTGASHHSMAGTASRIRRANNCGGTFGSQTGGGAAASGAGTDALARSASWCSCGTDPIWKRFRPGRRLRVLRVGSKSVTSSSGGVAASVWGGGAARAAPGRPVDDSLPRVLGSACCEELCVVPNVDDVGAARMVDCDDRDVSFTSTIRVQSSGSSRSQRSDVTCMLGRLETCQRLTMRCQCIH